MTTPHEKIMTSSHKTALMLSTVVSLTGFVVMAVYLFGFGFRWDAAAAFAQNVMSFPSAVCFLLSGAGFYFIARVMAKEIALAQVVIPVIFLSLSVFIAVHAISMSMGSLHAGAGETIDFESYDFLDQMILTHLSLGSMVNFILIAVAGLLAMTCAPCWKEKICAIGQVIIFVSVADLSRWFLNLDHLVGLVHKPMGIVSFLMFILLGAGLMTICRSK